MIEVELQSERRVVKTRFFIYCCFMRDYRYKKALQFAQKKHKGQFRDNGLPAWHHLVRVSAILERVFQETKEGSAKERETIVCAALGHDLFEDTDATEKEILEIFDARGLALIKGMTNRWGDKERKKYIRQMIQSEEAIRLTKLADLYDNITSVAYNLKSLGLPWTENYFLPIVTPMRHAVVKTRFRKYKKTAFLFIFIVGVAATLLDNEITHSRSIKKR